MNLAHAAQSRRVTPDADGIRRIRLSSASGLTVNVHLIEVGGTRVLFDSGFQHTAAELVEGLAVCGITLGDVDALFFTHSHEDHMGGAVALDGRIAFPTYAWSGTVPARTDWYSFYAELPRWDDWLAGLLPDNDRSAFVLAASRSRARRPFRAEGSGQLTRLVGVEFGEEVRVGPLRFVCIDARGHDPYHAAWVEPDRGWIFSGDVVLDVPTPILPPLRDEFSTYSETLARWQRELSATRLFPGHGRSTTDVPGSLDRSRAWVDAIVDATARLIGSGPVDPFDVVESIFGVPSSPGELRRAIIHLGNVHSHLIELAAEGRVVCRDDRLWIRGAQWK